MNESFIGILVSVVAVLVLVGCDRRQNPEAPSPSNERAAGSAESRPDNTKGKEKKAEQPDAPDGYSWYRGSAVGVSILKPDGWHIFKPIVSDGTYVFRMSRETPEEGFHTGLTLNIVRDVKEKSNVKPTIYAAHFIKEKAEVSKVIEIFDLVELARGMKCCGVTVEQEKTIGEITQQYTIHHTLFANDTTGALYILTFGTPSSKWEKDQDIWNTMRGVKLNPDL